MVPWHRLNGRTWWALGVICLASFLVMGHATFAANTKKSAPDLGPTMRFVVVRSSAPDMMLKVGLTTGLESVDEFTGSTICKSEPMPENCRVVSTSEVQADAPVKKVQACSRPKLAIEAG
jgi:hypothetical protein